MSFEEDFEEALRPNGEQAPNSPFRQERLEHELTQLPFRSWCDVCVEGKCKADQHRATGQLAESAVPVFSFDYALMGNTGLSSERGEDESAGQEDEQQEGSSGSDMIGILV